MNGPQSQTGRIVKHSTIYAVGNIARQLAGFLMLPIYTRYLTPADYGVVGLLTFAMAIMEPFFGARLGEAMPKYYFQQEDERKKRAVISTALMITGAVSASTSLILFFFRSETSSLLFGSSDYALAVGLFGILILTQAVEYYGMTFIRIQQRPKMFISVSLSKLAVQLVLNVSLVVWLEMGILGVVISGVVSSSLYAAGLTIYMVVKTGTRFDKTLAAAMLKFSWPLWFVGITSLYIYSGNRYYIRVFGSLADIGLYELAAKFATILTFLIWMPFNQFWETERFNYYRHGDARRIFSGTSHFIAVCLVAVALCIGIAAEPIIRIMAAPGFHEAHLAVPFLTIGSVLSCITTFATFSFLVTEQTRSVSYISYMTAAVVTILNLLLIPRYGYIGAAAALAMALLFQFIVTYRRGRALYDMGIPLRQTLLFIGLACITLLLSTFVFYSENIWIDVLAKALLLAAAMAVFATIVWQTSPDQAQIKSLAYSLKARLLG